MQCAMVCAQIYAVCNGLCKGLYNVQGSVHGFMQHAMVCARVFAMHNDLGKGLCSVQWFMQESVQCAMVCAWIYAVCKGLCKGLCSVQWPCIICVPPAALQWPCSAVRCAPARAGPGGTGHTLVAGSPPAPWALQGSAVSKPNQTKRRSSSPVSWDPPKTPQLSVLPAQGHKVHQDSGPGNATEASHAVSCSVCPPPSPVPSLCVCVQLRRETARFPLRADKPRAA